MKLLLLHLSIILLVLGVINAFQPSVLAEQKTESPKFKVENNGLQTIGANAYGVFDVETGEILFGKNIDEELPIASVTKLFTASAVLDSDKIEDEITITFNDVATEGRAGKLVPGQIYKIRDLIFPLLLESSNDAAAALERNIGQIPFGDKVLADASGLSDKNIATVDELAHEVSRVYKDAPYVFDVTKLKQSIGDQTGWMNNSPVRDLPGYMGGKHGYTEAANRTLVAVFTEVSLSDKELGYVILGSDNIRADVEKLRSFVENSVHLE
ncbi:D-alanyl-D-alanine carboxypeptidase [Candidatus Nomurabacteria bacterium]|nr:D-alanyl-D-alanine carboxypeptidase [Candidatus Kaiserbacteria bacterium]MCB9815269.1 D-alanyl-D-alanine carboxypeptidase [Candidatus Nomurabacteria bacterium]